MATLYDDPTLPHYCLRDGRTKLEFANDPRADTVFVYDLVRDPLGNRPRTAAEEELGELRALWARLRKHSWVESSASARLLSTR